MNPDNKRQDRLWLVCGSIRIAPTCVWHLVSQSGFISLRTRLVRACAKTRAFKYLYGPSLLGRIIALKCCWKNSSENIGWFLLTERDPVNYPPENKQSRSFYPWRLFDGKIIYARSRRAVTRVRACSRRKARRNRLSITRAKLLSAKRSRKMIGKAARWMLN